MPLYLCEKCAHEFENSSGAISCDWCGGKELKVLAAQTGVEKMLDTMCNPMFSRAKERMMMGKKATYDTIFEASNFECETEFFKCEDPDYIGITITDHGTGRVLDIFISRANLLAALNK